VGQHDNVTPEEKLISARLMAVHKFPYFASGIFALRPKEMPGLGTFATSQNGIMRWDPAFVQKFPIEQIAAVIVHEMFHLLMNHFERQKVHKADVIEIRKGEPRPMVDAEGKPVLDKDGKQIIQHEMQTIPLWNIAGDAEINDDLIAAQFKLPAHCITPKYFRETLKLEEAKDGLFAEDYYDMLLKGKKISNISFPHPCGGCSGNKLPDEEGDGTGKDKEGWSEAETYRVRREIAENIRKQEESQPGSVPAELLHVVDGILGPPQIPWQSELSRNIRRSVEDKLGASADYTYRRPNRRAHTNEVILPSLFYTSPKVCVIIDTSGSMTVEKRLQSGLEEINGILKASRARVEFIATDCDSEDKIKPVDVRNMKEVYKNLKGGGGTDFRTAFAYLEKRKAKMPDIIVYLTDGEGPAPESPPPHTPVIWVIISQKQAPAKWGKTIFIK